MLRERDPRKLIPPLARRRLLKNEQDVHLFERLAFLSRRGGVRLACDERSTTNETRASSGQHRAFRRHHRRRRHLRAWVAAYHLTTQCLGDRFWPSLRDAGKAFGVNLADPTVIPASAPTAICIPSAIASSRGPARPIATAAENPEVYGRGDRGERASPRPQSAINTGFSSARWSSQENLWTIGAVRTDTGEAVAPDREFLLDVPGLLSALRGLHAGVESGWRASRGRIVHPQKWPEDLDYRNKRVVVIGPPALRRQRLIPGHRRRLSACDDAAAFRPDLFQDRPQRHRDCRNPWRAPAGRRDLDS